MKRNRILLTSILLMASSIGCGHAPLSIYLAKYWLQTKTGPATIDIDGQWDAGEWGEAVFHQKDKTVYGSIGGYTAEGIIDGDKLYLVISARDSFRYHAILQLRDGWLQGKYGVPIATEGKYIYDTTVTRPWTLIRKENRP